MLAFSTSTASGRAPRRITGRPAAAVAALVVAFAAFASAGCASGSLRPGTLLEEARQRLGRPAVEHATPQGGRRLLYSLVLQTQALEFEPQGRLLRSENVLDEANFSRIALGMSRGEVR